VVLRVRVCACLYVFVCVRGLADLTSRPGWLVEKGRPQRWCDERIGLQQLGAHTGEVGIRARDEQFEPHHALGRSTGLAWVRQQSQVSGRGCQGLESIDEIVHLDWASGAVVGQQGGGIERTSSKWDGKKARREEFHRGELLILNNRRGVERVDEAGEFLAANTPKRWQRQLRGVITSDNYAAKRRDNTAAILSRLSTLTTFVLLPTCPI
jgi:hypothetical protein